MAATEVRRLRLWQNQIQTEVEITGTVRRLSICTDPGASLPTAPSSPA